MKHLFTLLLVMACIWSSVGQCTYFIDLRDSANDGWDGASLSVSINGATPTNYTLANGGSNTVSFAVNNGDTVTFTYNSGSYDNEVTYTVRRGQAVLFSDGPRPQIGLAYTHICGSCDPVWQLTANNITANTAAVGWSNSPSGGSTWIVEYGLRNFRLGTGTRVSTTTNPLTITGLNTDTGYDFYVYNICSPGDTSLVKGPMTFTTLCDAISTYPYQEGFNSNSTTQSCWSVLNQNGDTDTWDMNYTSNPFEGDQVAAIYTDYNRGRNNDFLISPQLTLTGRERLRFKHRCQSTTEPNDYRVVLSTTGRNAADFTNVLLRDTSKSTSYEEVIVDLTAYTGNVYVAFQIPPGGLDGWRLYIDDVLFERPTQNDAGVTALASPTSPTSTGFTPVQVEVTNYGLQPLSSFNVEWEIDGVAQTPVPYSGNPIANGATTIVNLGNLNIVSSNLNASFWTSMPNGLADDATQNDTLNTVLCSGLSGTYTVGHPTADFPTVAQVFDVLENCGVAGPVTFQFQPKTYTGPWKIKQILGVSATNTVTFDGLDRNTTTLTYNGLTEGAATIMFDGAQHVTVRNFTIENTGTTTAFGVLLTKKANYNTIDNNNIRMAISTANNIVGVLASASSTLSAGFQTKGDNANWTVISNNDIVGGRANILFEGGNTRTLNKGNKFIGNTLHNADQYGIYVDEQDSLVVRGNLIYDLVNSGSDAINLVDVPNAIITKNEIRASGDYGIAALATYSNSTSGLFIANNLVKAGDEALYLYRVTSSKIYHNTFSGGNYTCIISSHQNIDFRSNILATVSGTCIYINGTAPMSGMDYNLYYIAGSGSAVRYGSNTYPTLAAWQATSIVNYDVNSVSGNPNFVNGLHGSSALAVDAGDPTITLTEDVDGDTRPMGAAPDIGADEYVVIAHDAMVLNLVSPKGCGNDSADVIVEIANIGSNTLSSAPINVNVSGPTSAAFTRTVSTIAPGARLQLNVGTLSTSLGGTYNFEIIISSTLDGNRANDTLRTSVTIKPSNQNALTFTGDNIVCVGNTALIGATPSYSPVSIVWYDAPVGGNLVNIGSSFTTVPLTTDTTYYAAIQGCNSSRAAKTITVDTVGINVDLGADLTACGGSLVTITPTITKSNATRIEWQDGALTTAYNADRTGDYYATVTNANGCTDTDTVNVSVSPIPNIVDTISNVSCASASNGSIDLTITSGVGPFSYNWSNNATTKDITGLSGGFYTITVVDSGTVSNCNYVRTYQITEPILLAANIDNTNLDCDSTGGSINITVSGGTPAYTYLWTTGATTQDLSNASAGTQTVTITDLNGCTTTATSTIPAGTPIVITIDTIFPEVLSTQGGIQITATGGSSPSNLRYVWNTGATTDDLTGLVAGSYTVTVTDITTGCQKVLTGIVVPYQLPNDIDQLSNLNKLELYPNPTTGMVWINLNLSKATTTQLSVMSITGQIVQEFEPNEQLQQNYVVDLRNNPAGIYLARFIVGDEVKTMKIIVE